MYTDKQCTLKANNIHGSSFSTSLYRKIKITLDGIKHVFYDKELLNNNRILAANEIFMFVTPRAN